MLVIRLQRTGRENTPTYRLVVAEKARPVKGKFLEIVGHYLPARDPVIFEHDDAKITQWIAKGAIPSDTVARLLKRAGVQNMEKFIQTYTKRKSRKDAGSEPAASAGSAPAAAPAPVPAPEAEAPVAAEAEAPATAPQA